MNSPEQTPESRPAREKIRYDWVGMVLCFVLVTAALVFFGIAWCLVYHPEAVIHY